MKKIYTLLLALLVFVFSSGAMLAADNDYKNSLLKIELTELDDNNYDIGLYTQKIYNEPVKVIKKSDTVYYFLLPETSHSVTSVPPIGAVRNVTVKSYPYAGQDLTNGYTKVSVITSKPVHLTTSLRTLDPSVSPRLDPLRLARLDKVFERYSERLAQNNIPTPLAEFRKTKAAERPAIQNSVNVKENVVASKPADVRPAAQKPASAPARPAVTHAAQKQAPQVNKQAAQTQKQTAQAPAKRPIAQKPASAPAKKPAVQKPSVQVAAKKPAAQAPARKPAAVQVREQKPVTKPVVVAQNKPAVLPSKPAQPKQETLKPQTQAPAQTRLEEVKTPVQSAATAPVEPAEKAPAGPNLEKIKELEKQLATNEPVDVEFSRKVPVDTDIENKNIQAEVIQPVETENAPAETVQPKAPVENRQAQKQGSQNSNLLILAGVFAALMLAYLHAKKTAAKKRLAESEALALKESVKPSDIKDYFKNKASAKQRVEEPAPVQDSAPAPVEPAVIQAEVVSPVLNEPTEVTNPLLNDVPAEVSAEDEKVQAFNAYMESMNQEEEAPAAEITPHTEDDEVLRQLYTPIQTPFEENATAIYEDENDNITVEAGNDEATIVSASKLTETRGLYLAKFEGTTSLVGYIQDDIYVLYNFGDMEVSDGIQSSLAQENDTDSLYIVKTGGKKLMVKSTPYDMSLEMVM